MPGRSEIAGDGENGGGAHWAPPERRLTEQRERVRQRGWRRGRPPGRFPAEGGNSANRTAQEAQYTPSSMPQRSQIAPQPSQIFISTRKYFIFSILQGVQTPAASLGILHRSEGLARVAKVLGGCLRALAARFGKVQHLCFRPIGRCTQEKLDGAPSVSSALDPAGLELEVLSGTAGRRRRMSCLYL
jgi:hypothetical protein